MTRYDDWGVVLAVATGMWIVSSGIVVAQSNNSQATASDNSEVAQTESSHKKAKSKDLEETKSLGFRVTDLLGMEVYNGEEQQVGEVNDIVIDSKSGKVRYMAVSYGGYLGVGDKLFAVPFEAFSWTPDNDHPGMHRLLLNVTQQQMKGWKGFREEDWPRMADARFANGSKKGARAEQSEGKAGVNVEVGAGDVDVDVEADRGDR